MPMASDYVYQRSYRGKVQGVVLDWSGTTADAYVIAPAVVFVEVFKRQGVEISMLEARGPMGLRKDLHIKALTEVPEIRARWKEIKGSEPTQADVDAMFTDFVPLQIECLPEYTPLLPGVAEVTQKMQADGLKLGVSTGFIRPMVDVLLAAAKKQGFNPDATVAGDEVMHGARPKPFMVYRNLDLMDIHPIQSVVKVDDTASGVGEALEAGCWGVGVSLYSNYMDINTIAEAEAMPAEEIARRNALTAEILRKTGAHYVIDSIVDLPAVIDDINTRLARGERP
ncbi:MAG: phosphonoacetaldehyde hydrolase [Rhodospirillaceae bacterium]|jgi:phosphonoacetaldehyde hydrolase|nr:phosphonoacetaldehyde hydrolase [Rhodospirillaceae bacterium]MBT6139437.1 phosphonoacetaldehyde hydrolase [Rhodospirillaceae bacterium]